MQYRLLLVVTNVRDGSFYFENCGAHEEKFHLPLNDIPAELREKIAEGVYLTAQATYPDSGNRDVATKIGDFQLAPEPDQDDGLAPLT